MSPPLFPHISVSPGRRTNEPLFICVYIKSAAEPENKIIKGINESD